MLSRIAVEAGAFYTIASDEVSECDMIAKE